MNESEKADPALAPAEATPISPPPAPSAKPQAEMKPQAQKPGGKKRPPPDMPRRRQRTDSGVTLEDQQRFESGPKLRDLDAEIAAELESAMTGFSPNEIMRPETPPPPAQQGGTPDASGRKQGIVLSIHGPD